MLVVASLSLHAHLSDASVRASSSTAPLDQARGAPLSNADSRTDDSSRGQYAAEAKLLSDALAENGLAEVDQQRLGERLEAVIAARRQMIRLDSIERRIERGHLTDVSDRLESVLAEAVDNDVIARTESLINRSDSLLRSDPRAARADAYSTAGQYSAAAKLLNDALTATGLEHDERERLEKRLEAIQNARRQMVQLDYVERLIEKGQLTSASERLESVLAEAVDNEVITRTGSLLTRNESLPWAPFYVVWSWLLASAPFVLLAGAIWALRSLFIALSACWDRWRLADVADATGMGAKNLIAHFFSEWTQTQRKSVTSGLLTMEATSVPSSPVVLLAEERFYIPKALAEVDVSVGGVALGSLLQLFPALVHWFRPTAREIHGMAYLVGEDLCLRLTARLPGRCADRYKRRVGRVISVSALANGASDAAVEEAAAEVTFKMLYALKEETAASVDAANDLRKGLRCLQTYLSATPPQEGTLWDSLEEARALFEGARKRQPELLEAHIYEGIALDLMERHEDAAAHFDHVEQLTKESNDEAAVKLHSQAVYNGAVAHLRNLYSLSEIDEAITRLDRLVEANPDLEKYPLSALASATLADAWANRTVQWKQILPESVGLEADAPEDERLVAIIKSHEEKVLCTTKKVKLALESTEDSTAGWDAAARRQVKWAVYNALGDFYLYAAVQLTKIDVEHSERFRALTDIRQSDEFKSHVALAMNALRTCEMLLPAGVETLSNIGTLYLIRDGASDLAHARRYLKKAIALNAHYEYAYYRLAQCWEKERWRENVIATLKSCPTPPQIPQFRAMFREYFVEPKFSYPGEDPTPRK